VIELQYWSNIERYNFTYKKKHRFKFTNEIDFVRHICFFQINISTIQRVWIYVIKRKESEWLWKIEPMLVYLLQIKVGYIAKSKVYSFLWVKKRCTDWMFQTLFFFLSQNLTSAGGGQGGYYYCYFLSGDQKLWPLITQHSLFST
jgi:hypothetical protein